MQKTFANGVWSKSVGLSMMINTHTAGKGGDMYWTVLFVFLALIYWANDRKEKHFESMSCLDDDDVYLPDRHEHREL